MNIYSTCMSATTQSAQTKGYSRETHSLTYFVTTASYTWIIVDLEKKDSNDFSVCEDIFQNHSCYSMKTMNIHPFDNNHISTTFSAVTESVWTFIGIHFSPLQTDNKLNYHHHWKRFVIIFPPTRTTSTF